MLTAGPVVAHKALCAFGGFVAVLQAPFSSLAVAKPWRVMLAVQVVLCAAMRVRLNDLRPEYQLQLCAAVPAEFLYDWGHNTCVASRQVMMSEPLCLACIIEVSQADRSSVVCGGQLLPSPL